MVLLVGSTTLRVQAAYSALTTVSMETALPQVAKAARAF
jgi:hypothetical protein